MRVWRLEIRRRETEMEEDAYSFDISGSHWSFFFRVGFWVFDVK